MRVIQNCVPASEFDVKLIRRLFVSGLTILSLGVWASSNVSRADPADNQETVAVPQPELVTPAPNVPESAAQNPLAGTLAESTATQASQPQDTAPANIDFWRVMLNGFAIPSLAMPSVNELTRLYANNPDFLTRSIQRSTPYIHEIIISLTQRGMPTDLALLPVIESGFDPKALSPAAAAGIWQFIPETGRHFGLKQDWLRDERRDPLAATRAAINYLQTLYNAFGDWHLALAAYNCGESCVARAIQKSRSTGGGRDFASIAPFLPQETRDYVPRFVAVRNVFSNINSNGIRLPYIHQKQRITSIYVNQAVDLPSVARLAGVNYDELAILNAGILRQVVPSDGSLIWLPENALAKLQESIATPREKESSVSLMSLKAARARNGESLEAFAARHLTTVSELRRINNINASLNTIQSGTLFVPSSSDEAFTGETTSLSPLKMVGEQTLIMRIKLARQGDRLLASHPKLAGKSGWIPGRLHLAGSRAKKRIRR